MEARKEARKCKARVANSIDIYVSLAVHGQAGAPGEWGDRGEPKTKNTKEMAALPYLNTS